MTPNDQEPLSAQKINKNIYDHVKEIGKEFKAGFATLERYPNTVTIFGSARSKPDSFHYKEATKLAGKIVKELNLTITTGGGPGIMEAAAKGATEAGGKALGLTIQLPRGQITNKYVTESCDFKYFFIRKAIGWVLREYSKTNPKAVEKFITRHELRLSNLSIREGSKYLDNF